MTAMRLKPIRDIPQTPCPVCRYGDTSAVAIAAHNLRCALYGERSYTRRTTYTSHTGGTDGE